MTIKELLSDADPYRHEPPPSEAARHQIRQRITAAAPDISAALPRAFLTRRLLLMAAMAGLALWIVGGRWRDGNATVQAAAVHFELRLAEDQPAPGLQEAQVGRTGQIMYLHEEVVVSNDDVAYSRIVAGDDASHFNVIVEFTEAGGEKMRQATADRLGGRIASASGADRERDRQALRGGRSLPRTRSRA
jgi:hypothetical protein